jgi:hypothetical protein
MTASPRPWRVDPDWKNDGGMDGCPVFDANGKEVIGPSEWLDMKQEDVELIVEAVNAYKPTTTDTNQKFDWGEVFGPFIPIIFGMATLIGVPALIDWLQN